MKTRKHITVLFHSYGHWKVIATKYGKEITCITTDVRNVDKHKDGIYAATYRLYKQCVNN